MQCISSPADKLVSLMQSQSMQNTDRLPPRDESHSGPVAGYIHAGEPSHFDWELGGEHMMNLEHCLLDAVTPT
jgi:hypothetical protein